MNPSDATPNPTSGPSQRNHNKAKRKSVVKGDFTANIRLVWLSVLAVLVGIACAVVALVLQRLIALFTNVFYFQHLRDSATN